MARELDWSYHGNTGPSYWYKNYPLCNGNSQSPINVILDDVLFNPRLLQNRLKLNFSRSGQQSLVPTNASFQVSFNNEDYYLTGGALSSGDQYKLEQFHFHVGKDSFEGSEHLISGYKFCSEVHFVFWNTSRYDSFANAVGKPDGVAVLALFIQESNHGNVEFKPLFTVLKRQLTERNQLQFETLSSSINIESIFRQINMDQYFTYSGSLTTPPCCEGIRWFLFARPLDFSFRQVYVLRCALSGGNDHNFRPPCPMNNRIVESSFVNDGND